MSGARKRLLDDTLRSLARHAYAGFYPCRPAESAESYLVDLWREAPWSFALAHTAAAVFLLFSPLLFLGKPCLLAQLPEGERDKLLSRLLSCRFYPVRLAAYGARSAALVAGLRGLAGPRVASRPSGAEGLPACAEYIVVGSGAAGAAAAHALAKSGHEVVVLEEGGWYRASDYTHDLHGAMRTLFRDFGSQVAKGRARIPVLQGSCVGGTTVINGAICHRLPREIHEEWCRDRQLERAIPFSALEHHSAALEAELGVAVSGAFEADRPAMRALRSLGWKFRAMARNAPGCEGSGRCLQGCPSGGKLSMEASLLPRAVDLGARVVAQCRVRRVILRGSTAVGVLVETRSGEKREIRAGRAVILAAGAIHTPCLLRASGLSSPSLGRHLQAHLGVGGIGLLAERVRDVEGPPQGIEVLEFASDGVKLATQLLPPELLLARSSLVGRDLVQVFAERERISSWTASIRAEAEGMVRGGTRGRPIIRYEPSARDLARVRFGLEKLESLFRELGARRFFPGAVEGPALDPRSYYLGIGHVFGTCRLGSRARDSVVSPSFRPHGTRRLYVVDASVFPSAPGVSPQLPIMALARHAASGILEEGA